VNALERRWVFVLLGVLGLNLAAYLVFTLPRSIQQRGLASRREVLANEIELERQRIISVRDTSDAIDANTRDTKRFFDELVGTSPQRLVSTLKTIEQLATDKGLKLGQQGFSNDPVKGLPLERLKVQMPMEGSYRQLVGFLSSLEGSGVFLTLDQIAVRGASQGGDKAQLDLVLSCYFRSNETKP
jgi:Tfp pilus assembly protein PilO